MSFFSIFEKIKYFFNTLRIFLLSFVLASSSWLYAQHFIQEVRGVIQRFAGEVPVKLKLSFY